MELKIILPFCLFAFTCLAFAGVFIGFKIKKGPSPFTLLFKILASLTFVFSALYASSLNGNFEGNILIVVGLVFALIGDIFIELYNQTSIHKKFALNSGIAFFTCSSIFYFVSALLFWKDLEKFYLIAVGSVIIAIIIAIIIQLLERPLKLNFAGYKIQVFVYSLFVSLACVLPLCICIYYPGFALFAVGALLVMISDMLLSNIIFGNTSHKTVLDIVLHILYYIGEMLIASYIFFQLV